MGNQRHIVSAEMAGILGISVKTLHRQRKQENSIFRPGVHFFNRTPLSSELVWNAEKTEKAWLIASRPVTGGAA